MPTSISNRVVETANDVVTLWIQHATYLNIIEEEMCISQIEYHLLHPEAQLYNRVGILNRDKQHL
jgi:hypothetical protein